MLRLQWGAATDVGRVRGHNEDSMLVSPTVFAVADGMGGHAAGEVASSLAVNSLVGLAEQQPITAQQVLDAIWQANGAIAEAGAERGDRLSMATTLTGIAAVTGADGDQWAVFNVGDSRVYRFADDVLTQLTVDHSAVQELVDAGELTPDQALTHPRRNVVTRSLGSEPGVRTDIWLYAPVPGDRFLVCSDGLTNELVDTEIAVVLLELTDPQQAAEQLVASALTAGGRDNVTAVVLDLVSID